MDTAGETAPDGGAALVERGRVYALLARLLGPHPDAFTDRVTLPALRAALHAVGDVAAADALGALDDLGPDALVTRAVAARRTRLFEQGAVAPYEMSHVPAGLGGNTARIADVAGFYRAFGFRVEGERPDHCAAELEFAAFLSIGEAQAAYDGDEEGRAVCAAAHGTFLRDHLAGWLDRLAARLAEADPGGPYGPVVAAAAHFVDAEATRRGVERVPSPLAVGPVGAALGAVAGDDPGVGPTCGGCPAAPAPTV